MGTRRVIVNNLFSDGLTGLSGIRAIKQVCCYMADWWNIQYTMAAVDVYLRLFWCVCV